MLISFWFKFGSALSMLEFITFLDLKNGQIKVIIMTVDGGDATVTPTTLATGTTITFGAQK